MKHVKLDTMIRKVGSTAELAKQLNLSYSMIRTARAQISRGRNYQVLVDADGKPVALEEYIGWRRVGWK